MIALPVILGLALAAPVPQAADFETALRTTDVAALRHWFEEHPASVFVKTRNELLDYVGGRDGWSAAQVAAARGRLAAVVEALDGAPPTDLVEHVLAWDAAGCRRFVGTWRELSASREPSDPVAGDPPVVDRDALEALRASLTAQEAGALLSQGLADLVARLYATDHLALARDWVLWIHGDALAHGNPWGRAWAAEWLGRFAWRHGDLARARTRLTEAVTLERALGGSGYLARLLTDLASVCLSAGELEAGLEHTAEASAIAERSGDGERSLLAREVRAGLLLELDELQASFELSRELAADAEDAPLLLRARIALLSANILSEAGRLESARTYAERALALLAGSDGAPDVKHEIELVLGLVLGDLDRPSEGLAILDRALVGFEELRTPRGVGWAQKNRGYVLLRAGRYPEARAAFETGRAVGDELASPFLEGYCALGIAESIVLGARGTRAFDRAELAAALETAERCGEHLGDLHMSWRICAVRGRALVADDRDAEALDAFLAAVDLIERWRRHLGRPALLTHSLRMYSDPYREAAFAAARLGRTEEAIRCSELLRARTLFERRSRSTGPLALEQDPRVHECRRTLAHAASRLRALGPDATSGERSALQDALRRAEADLDAALVDAEARNERASRYSGAAPAPLDSAELAALVADSEFDVVVAYLVGADATLAVRASGEGVRVRALAAGAAELRELVLGVRQPIEQLRRGQVDLAHLGFDTDAAHRLHELLVEPLELPAGACLGIVGDDTLTSLPFGILIRALDPRPWSEEVPFAHLTGHRYLIEDHDVGYLTSFEALRSRPRRTLDGTVALFTGPADGTTPAEDEEVRAVTAAVGAERVVLVRSATPADVRERAPTARILHFVTHGTLDSSYPMQSHLVLAGVPDLERLEAWRVEELALDASLTVLSACHTAEGTWLPGEGLLGLAHSFLAAGSDRVIATQWAVDGPSSAHITSRFHILGEELDPVRALSRARRELLLASRRRGGLEGHPYFWGPWSLVR